MKNIQLYRDKDIQAWEEARKIAELHIEEEDPSDARVLAEIVCMYKGIDYEDQPACPPEERVQL